MSAFAARAKSRGVRSGVDGLPIRDIVNRMDVGVPPMLHSECNICGEPYTSCRCEAGWDYSSNPEE